MTKTESTPPAAATQRRRAWASRATIAALLALFAILSYSAARTKSATFDEPLHAVGGFMHVHYHDYRINPEDPALFGIWAALPHGRASLSVNARSPEFLAASAHASVQWPFVVNTLYRTPGNDADAFINTSRFMFTLLGVALGAVIACWSWKLAGAAAALVATFLFALDPNFLAHASLVKNDVMLSLVMAAAGLAIWSFGRDGHAWQLLVVGLLCGVAANVKFSGVLLGPIVVLLFLIRALMPAPWRVMSIALSSVAHRLLAVPLLAALVLLASWAVTWAVYGFRFAPTPDGKLLNTAEYFERAKFREFWAAEGRQPTTDEFNSGTAGVLPRMVQRLEEEQLVPQAWLFGLLHTYTFAQLRSSFLMGQTRLTGWWYYFPLAMLFKTPLATLVAILVTVSIAPWLRRLRPQQPSGLPFWAGACLSLPPVIYGIVAMGGNLNIGLRHILPVYPFIYIAVGIAFARVLSWRPKVATIAMVLVGLGLAAESLTSWPNYLPFFNVASGGSRGGIRLLGDSNLDWGQDLKALGAWQRAHKDRPLYLSNFGVVPPEYYGIDCSYLMGAAKSLKRVHLWEIRRDQPAYLAVFASNLQPIYIDKQEFAALREATPREVLNGTIYLYDWPLPASSTTQP